MKKYSSYYIVGLLVLLLTACSKNLETSPTDAAKEDAVFENAETAETAINGILYYLNETYSTFANPGYSSILRTSDAMGSDVAVLTNKYGFAGPYGFTDVSNNTSSRSNFYWTLLYKVINNANAVIARIDAVPGAQVQKDKIKAQAKALRAFAYFNLVSFYQFTYLKDPSALAVPIYTEPTTVHSKPNQRSTVAQVYALIIQDLTEALPLIDSYRRGSSEKHKIDRAVIHGFLARAYLNTGEWKLAAVQAKEARTGYPLMDADAYSAGFNSMANVEWIWGHGQTAEQSGASYIFHYLDVSSSGSYYYSFMADPFFKNLFEKNDSRYRLFEWDGSEGREGLLRYKKFIFRSNLTADIVYMRSSEMYLIEAEGLARAGEETQAIEALNTLRAARQAKNFSSGNLVDSILVERRKELWGEGFALSDILRTQGTVKRQPYVDAQNRPIPVEITTNTGLIKLVNGIGHSIFRLPENKVFVPNSSYYIFAIPQIESDRNK